MGEPIRVGDEYLIAAEDGGTIHAFAAGRHLRTIDALTGALRYRFGHDGEGRLVTVDDGNGNITTIERGGNGAPLAIVAPFSQRTELARDADGYLNEITNSAGEAFRAEYAPGGLLTAFTDPRGNIRRYTYDPEGRLTEAADPLGATKTLAHDGLPDRRNLTLTTATGRSWFYTLEQPPGGQERRTVTAPTGLRAVSTRDPGGRYTSETPDGLRTTIEPAADPRWGGQVLLPGRWTIATPGGLTSTVSVARTAVLANPSNPLHLVSQTDTVLANGRTYTSIYERSSRSLTVSTPAGGRVTTTLDASGAPVSEQVGGLFRRAWRMTSGSADGGRQRHGNGCAHVRLRLRP